MLQQNSVATAELRGRVEHRSFPEGLPGLIRAISRRRPDAVAATDDAGTLTYRDLELRSDRLARMLRRTAPPDRPVAVAVPRGFGLQVALLGVLKAGVPYLPVDPEDSSVRTREMVRGADCAVAVVAGGGRAIAELCGLRTVDVPAAPDAERVDPLPAVAADDPVQVLFTSGSTGTPKAVAVPSAALCNRLVWMRDTYGIGADDRVLQRTPITFDVSGWELFLPLISGARCVFLAPDHHRDQVAVAAAIAAHGITVCHFVPSALREFLRWPDAARCTTLRHVFCSGDALPAGVARNFVATLPAALHNLYGPTEAAIDVTAWTCPPTPGEVDRVYIGRPIDNCVLTILGDDGLPVPPGAEGELHIGGIPLSRGYLGRPELTSRAFVDALPGSSVDRLYRTGDRVRMVDGELEFLGRIDDQVQISGQRVEPGEIEHHLLASPDVVAAVVVAVDDGADISLVAWIQPATEGNPDALCKRLRAHLSARLPEPYVPGRFVRLRRIPLNRNGKQDRALLKRRALEQLHARPAASACYSS
ncbi:amino acid adenylation domain-containing protein [Nocardia terpenica]|uniref:Amino acid adenylation domain-containing protein n=1 Tax=Nocardia terpenica TaxID=455432 RepID=A0A164JFM5_9NOCA|nr:amino acid adenylation domain-containing protein [Nocardia terpenica]KZM70353.1 hypothetical protein AWN90_03445 [Nocardia terpenica]NQE91028.1 amino acid adenylation domain-containing protein [Nocardia terpenica]